MALNKNTERPIAQYSFLSLVQDTTGCLGGKMKHFKALQTSTIVCMYAWPYMHVWLYYCMSIFRLNE